MGRPEANERKESLLVPMGDQRAGGEEVADGVEAQAVRAEERPSMFLFLAVLLTCFSPLLFGFNISFTSPTQLTMEGDKQGGIRPPPAFREFTVDSEKWYASLFNIGAMFGALSGSALSDRFGRRRTLAFTAIPHMIAWGGTAAIKIPEVLIALRILSGWTVGVGSAVAPCYLAEISTTRLRGALGASHQLSITLGILLVSVLGNYVFLVDYEHEKFSNWRDLALFGFALAIPLLFMLCMPESPRWFAKVGQAESVISSLRQLRSSVSIEHEASTILAESPSAAASAAGRQQLDQEVAQTSLFVTYRMSLIVGIGLLFFQQSMGANAVMMYATKICKEAHMSDPGLAALGIMAIQVIFTGISCVLVEKAGRRPLLLFAALSVAVAHAMLCFYYFARHLGWAVPSFLALGGLVIFIVGFSLGMGPVPWLILAELFPTEVRGTASSIAIAVNWLSSFVITLTFQPLQDAITPQGTFGLFCIISIACFFFVKALVPETKGKTVDEVLAAMRRSGARTEMDVPLASAE